MATKPSSKTKSSDLLDAALQTKAAGIMKPMKAPAKASAPLAESTRTRVRVSELKAESEDLRAHKLEYLLYSKAYTGGTEFGEWGLERHERETDKSFRYRLRTVLPITFSQNIVEQYANYMAWKAILRKVGSASDDPRWQQFTMDADRNGNTLDEVMATARTMASIYGHCGILVDAPIFTGSNNRAESAAKKEYPYFALFSPLNILQQEHSLNAYGRPVVSLLRLVDSYGCYYILDQIGTRKFRLPRADEDQEFGVMLGDEIPNTDGKIRFHILMNLVNPLDPKRGISDLKEAAPADRSILQNISQMDEINMNASFPFMLMADDSETDADSDGVVVVGPKSILPFDATNPDSKPSWLAPESLNAITALLKTIEWKIKAVMINSKLEAFSTGSESKQARSGASMRKGMEPLIVELLKKIRNVTRCEKLLLQDWCELAGLPIASSEIEVTRSREFGLDDISLTLDQLEASTNMVASKTFYKRIQEQVVTRLLPDLTEDMLAQILDEININSEKMTFPIPPKTMSTKAPSDRIMKSNENSQIGAQI